MDITVYDVALVPLTLGVVEVVKRIGLPNKYAPLLALIVGTLLGVSTTQGDKLKGVITGIAIGLSASGLYSAVKVPIKKDNEK